MEKEYEIISEKVLKGTIRAIDKLIIESERTGKKLVVSKKFDSTDKKSNLSDSYNLFTYPIK
jgi:hypothetical protein